jgi:RimJ/RimL family protein N-acetyltransferase
MDKTWTTPRLRIRQFRLDDWPALHELQGDPEATRLIGGVWTEQKTREITKLIVANYQSKELEWFAVADLASDVVIGACWLCPMNARWCDALGVGPQIELGYRYARRHWGKGYATEAAAAMLRRGFGELSLPRIASIVDVRNRRSERVLQKLGMSPGGEAERDGVTVRSYALANERAAARSAGPGGL